MIVVLPIAVVLVTIVLLLAVVLVTLVMLSAVVLVTMVLLVAVVLVTTVLRVDAALRHGRLLVLLLLALLSPGLVLQVLGRHVLVHVLAPRREDGRVRVELEEGHVGGRSRRDEGRDHQVLGLLEVVLLPVVVLPLILLPGVLLQVSVLSGVLLPHSWWPCRRDLDDDVLGHGHSDVLVVRVSLLVHVVRVLVAAPPHSRFRCGQSASACGAASHGGPMCSGLPHSQ